MNKFKLFPLALAALAFSACTSEDAVDNNPVTGEGTRSYVAVNINNVGSSGTRADVYEDGNAQENAISKVRFYFFTPSLSAACCGLVSAHHPLPLQTVPVPSLDDLILFDIPNALATPFSFFECE